MCIDEVNTVGRKGLSLQKDSWTKLGRILKEKFGMDLSQKQMKNAYDNLKAKYVGWVYLRNKTGNIYNPQTNTFSLTVEEWDDFKKGHPKAATLKTMSLPFPELCATLFDGNNATGNCKWTSTQSTSGGGSSSCNRVQTLHIMDNPFNEIEDDDSTSRQPSAPTADRPPNVDHSPSFDDSPNVEHSPTPDRATKKPKPSKHQLPIRKDQQLTI